MKRDITVPLLVACTLIATTLSFGLSIERSADGGYIVETENYSAKVGADGNLHSLVSGSTEFLLTGYKGLVGGGYITIREGEAWSAETFLFKSVEQTDTASITARAENHVLTYTFLPDAIDFSFSHTSEPTIWYFVINPAVGAIIEHESGETVPLKTARREGTMQIFDAAGTNILLPSGALYYIAKNARDKPDTDPMVLQVWMPRTWNKEVLTKRIVIHSKPTLADALDARLKVEPSNHIFRRKQPAGILLEASVRFPVPAVQMKAELTVANALSKDEVYHRTTDLEVSPQRAGRFVFSTTPPPGFYNAVLTMRHGDDVLAIRRFPLVYDIDHISPPERPPDFDAFWDATLAEQEKVPANVQVTLHRAETTHRLYKLRFDGLLGRRFHAWLSIPVKEGKYPAHLTLPPSGIHSPYLPYSGVEVVGMSLAIAGQDVEPPNGGYKHWDYWRSGIDKRETWYYRAVFAACSRAVDILAARPEVDTGRIFVTGGSQGGGLAFITAALNPKVTMAVCGSPGLFGLEWRLRYLGRNYWPPIDIVDERGQPVTDGQAFEDRCGVVRYGDAANFARRLKGAVLLNIGLQDYVTSPVAVITAWSQLTNVSIRAMLADPWGGHNGPRGGQALASSWFRALCDGHPERVLELKDADALPVMVETPQRG